MSNLIHLMSRHGIDYVAQGERLFVLDVLSRVEGSRCIWVEATGWTMREAKIWLGY